MAESLARNGMETGGGGAFGIISNVPCPTGQQSSANKPQLVLSAEEKRSRSTIVPATREPEFSGNTTMHTSRDNLAPEPQAKTYHALMMISILTICAV